MQLQGSKTLHNLMRAFAGESMARNRYTFAAQAAENGKLQLIGAVFRYTAGQEKEHAEIFADYLRRAGVEQLEFTGSFPVDLKTDIPGLLRAAVHNETQEQQDTYPAFAAAARQEGFDELARKWDLIAGIEKEHAARFESFLRLMDEGKLFASDVEEKWVCLNCGHELLAKAAPAKCPVCNHDQGYFIRATLSPYSCG